MTVSRDELHRLVWSEPMTKVAKQFNVSGSYMARICTIMNVPRPERGHWAKLAVGRAAPPKPLPEARPGDLLYWSKDGEVQPAPKPRAPNIRSGTRVRIPRNRIHGLIRGAEEHFENGRTVGNDAYPRRRTLLGRTGPEKARFALDRSGVRRAGNRPIEIDRFFRCSPWRPARRPRSIAA